METIIQVNMKLKNYIRIVSFADYCINNKLVFYGLDELIEIDA